MRTKHDFYREQLAGTDKVLCKESAAEFLDLSNGDFTEDIYFYQKSEAEGKDVIFDYGIYCTSINQTLNDLLADPDSDDQVIIESLSNYYFEHHESFEGITFCTSENEARFQSFKQAAIEYYNE